MSRRGSAQKVAVTWKGENGAARRRELRGVAWREGAGFEARGARREVRGEGETTRVFGSHCVGTSASDGLREERVVVGGERAIRAGGTDLHLRAAHLVKAKRCAPAVAEFAPGIDGAVPR